MRGQQHQFIHQRLARSLRLGVCHLRAQHDVTEQAGRGGSIDRARAQLVHREAQHVGRPRLIHPLHVQRFHGALVDENDRDLGIRADVQLGEVERREALQHRLVDLDARLVVDLDHDSPRFGIRSRGPSRNPARRSARFANSCAC